MANFLVVKKSDLFGDMSSDDSDNELPGKKADLRSDDDSMGGSPQVTRRKSPKSDDDEKREETTIPVEIPKINTNLGENIHFVRYVLQ